MNQPTPNEVPKKQLPLPTKLAALAVVIFALAIGGVMTARITDDEPTEDPAGDSSSSADSDDRHILGTETEGDVTLVEFLDFECEACRAAFPFVEDLREKYEGEVTFVVRHFPIPSHANSTTSAAAVDAAGEQGKFEEMYRKMFETQGTWGEQQDSNAALFREFAEELGLDMERYDRDVESEEILDHIGDDQQDGVKLGVEGTPTFFLNGELLQPSSTEDFTAAIDEAIADS